MSSQIGDDVEYASGPLLPLLDETPELRWPFIRKIYNILILQLLATIAVAAIVMAAHPLVRFFNTTWGLVIYAVIVIIVPLIVIFALYVLKYVHPLHFVNFILLGIFNLVFGFAFGVLSAFVGGKVVIETAIVTMVVFISIIAYTFWAERRSQDYFGFLVPFLLSIGVIVIMFTIFQIFFPLGKISEIIYSGLIVLIFCAFIIYDTEKKIRQYSYYVYIWASISLYLDVFSVPLVLLGELIAILRAFF